MFRSVIERQRAGRLGTGVWVSIGVHVALFAAVLVISARPAELPPEPEKEYVLKLNPGPNLAKGSPAPAAPKQANSQPPRKPRNKDRAPTQVQPLPTEPPAPVEPTAPDTGNTDETAEPGEGVAGGHPDGDENSTAIGVPLIPGLTGGTGQGGTGTEVLQFGQGMTPPVLMGGTPIDYTPAARAARVEGTLIAKCVVTVEGRVRDCRLIKGLPHMDESVVDALESRRYRPVTYQGRAVSVSYVFTVRLSLPR
ncbi:energy transducer TonB [Pyxidicoccus trucidator]|uniref:energy transducer TonB n=1 Tax=Pyxidicoccus trucidator TaxID=2709662 RepID=UPI0013DB1BBE|nr:energy transducer TonB [Pyxidicoccus trucidator]